jgi:GT2 family glycosyltransferase
MIDTSLTMVVGIATLRRPQILTATLSVLSGQTRLPDRLVICSVSPSDVERTSMEQFPAPVTMISGKIGSSAQRNAIISEAADADIVVFFDDDFFADANYLANLENLFLSDSSISGVTGSLFADGAQGPGISVDQGLEIIRSETVNPSATTAVDYYGTYGCNMAFRMTPIRQNAILFDEQLPLYGWQEDIDFSVRIGRFGRVVKVGNLCGVHLGTKLGRTSGVRFGYSQIANPIYLVRKGTMSWRHALKLMLRNVAANIGRSLRPEPWVDRKGRLKGNFLAVIDFAKGTISPSRIIQLE